MEIIKLPKLKLVNSNTVVDKKAAKVIVDSIATGDGMTLVSAPKQIFKNAQVKIVEQEYENFTEYELYINGKQLMGDVAKATQKGDTITVKLVTETI